MERVYFEFLIRHRDPGFDTAGFIGILQSLGCRASVPRYPLLHQQPFFREGHGAEVGRNPAEVLLPDYTGLKLSATERLNHRLIKLPNFCHPAAELLDQYRAAFEWAIAGRAG